ncbi:hypothetical protein EHS25_002226 [Saitozyma podzolica]|uniref:Transaldolase n=1 Tax=Saitozyma podzolica TaxID=1890683 RepID=A0A427YES5_9TREE|nr:hypothetical protein EHS25_002226 [Saitozyma podzolica]
MPVATTTHRSLLEKLEQDYCNIDVDSLDAAVAKAMPFKPHNQTSNQVIVLTAMVAPENRGDVLAVCREHKDKGWEYIYDRIAARLCKKNIVNITERVLLQTSARKAYDKEGVLAHARSYAAAFEEVGIPRDRFCIKVPCTGPALAAARILNDEGIRTLGTSLFGLPQAIAASQAGCLYISPYYNECRAHAELDTLWPNVEDPATQHPFSFRTRHILETYQKLYQETGKEQPKVLSASFVNAKEVVANAELGVWGMTLPPALLKEMANTPDDGPVPSDPKPYHPYAKKGPVPARFAEMSTKDPLAGANWDGKLASTEIDYIANNGAALDKANKEDPVVGPRLQDALDIFVQADADVKAEIEKVLASI